MTGVNIREIRVTQWTSIFRMTNAWCYTIIYGQKSHSFKVQDRPGGFMDRVEKFIYTVSDSKLQVTFFFFLITFK